MEDRDLNQLCVQLLLNMSAEIERFVDKIVEMNSIRVVLDIARTPSGGQEFKRLAGAFLHNISSHPKVGDLMTMRASDDNSFPLLLGCKAIISINEPQTIRHVAVVLHNLAAHSQVLCCVLIPLQVKKSM